MVNRWGECVGYQGGGGEVGVGCGVATRSCWLVYSQHERVSGLPAQRWRVWREEMARRE